MRGRDGRYAQGSPCIHKAYGREAQKRKKDAYYSQRAELLRLHSLQGRLPGGIDPFRHFRNNGPEDTWDDRSFETRMWRMIFFSDLCLRPYCYACPYASLHKPADITMGDFWGIDVCLPEFDDGKQREGAVLGGLSGARI